MKIISIFGSPRDNGFSSSMHGIFLRGIAGKDVAVRRIHVYQENISPCTACDHCRDAFECIIKDEMTGIYEELLEADGITISSPVYFSSLPGQLKNFIDRCQVLWEKRRRDGAFTKKKAGYLILASGTEYPNVFVPSVTVIRHYFNVMQCSFHEDDYTLLPNVDELSGIPEKIGRSLNERSIKFLQLLGHTGMTKGNL